MAYNIVATWLFSYGLSINILFKKFSMHSLNRRRYSLFHTRISYDQFNTSWFPKSFDFQYYILLWYDILNITCRSRISYIPHYCKKLSNEIWDFQTTAYTSPCNSMIAWGAYRERTFQSSGEIHNQLSFRFRPGLVLFSYYCSYAAFNVIIFFVISSIFILGEFFFFECQWDMYERMSITKPVFSLNVVYRIYHSFYLFVVMCFN